MEKEQSRGKQKKLNGKVKEKYIEKWKKISKTNKEKQQKV